MEPILTQDEIVKIKGSMFKRLCKGCQQREGLKFKPRDLKISHEYGLVYRDEDTALFLCKTCQDEYKAAYKARHTLPPDLRWKLIRGPLVFLIVLFSLLGGSLLYLTQWVDQNAWWVPSTHAGQVYEKQVEHGVGKPCDYVNDPNCEVG